ncbi:MAG: HAD family hydrolase [Pseudomonadota bacterium]
MPLAIFDLDNTLLGGDSDHAWGQFACEKNLVDADVFSRANDAFYADYQDGRLDIDAYLRHALAPIAGMTLAEADNWHRQFMQEKIAAMMLPKAAALVQRHRKAGDDLLIITATNRFIAAPIARELGVTELLACDVEIDAGRYTGAPEGIPTYAEGKVLRLREWLDANHLTLDGSWAYSDSFNDIPLLEAAEHAVAVDPDARLERHAKAMGWEVISLRS